MFAEIFHILTALGICWCGNIHHNDTMMLNSTNLVPAELRSTNNMTEVMISSGQVQNESISDIASSVTRFMTTGSQNSSDLLTPGPYWHITEEATVTMSESISIPDPTIPPDSFETVFPYDYHASCQDCLPEFLGGADFYHSMTRWNNLVCGKHVCDISFEENGDCGMVSCADCQCDENCFRYGDCCPDIFLNQAPKDPITEFTCVSEAFIQATDSSPKRYLMVASCPEKLTKDDDLAKDKCLHNDPLNIVESTPVYSQAVDLHYKNLHCANCHGISKFTHWSIESGCQSYVDYSQVTSPEQLLGFLRGEEHCHVHFTPPKLATARPCYHDSDLITTCNATGQWKTENYVPEIELACELFTEPTSFGFENSITYKNPFCAYCNGGTLYRPTGDCDGSIVEPGTVPFSVLFNFRNNQLYDDGSAGTESNKCVSNQVYDPIKKMCRALVCPSGKYPVEHVCENFVSSSKGIGYIAHYALKPRHASLALIFRDVFDFAYGVSRHARSILSWIVMDFYVLDMQIQYSVVNVSDGETANKIRNLDIQFAMLVGEMIPKDEMEMLLINYVKGGWWYYDTDDADPIYFDSEWLTGVSDERIDFIQSSTREISNTGVFDKETVFEINPVAFNFQFGKTIPDIYQFNTTAYILVNELMQCNLIELSETEYNESLSGDIVVNFSGEILSPGQYTKHGERVRICTNFSGQPNTSSSDEISALFDDTEVIITIICTSLSLAGLTITFVVYLLKPSLRTLPGKNNMVLFANLFMAQLMFQSGAAADVTKPLCQTIGVVIHYFWLSSFCWKFVCAFHMFRIFTNPLKMLREFRTFLHYVLFAQAFPLIIICVYIMIHYLVSNNASIGYADRYIGQGKKLCFLSSSLDVALGFVFPVGFALLLNALLFSRVVYALRTRADIPRHSAKSDINETVIYLKMSVLLGFTWGLGFVALAANIQFLWTVFTVVNASIGVFVFFSFGLKKASFRKWVDGKSTTSANGNPTHTKLGNSAFTKGRKELTDIRCVPSPCESPILSRNAP